MTEKYRWGRAVATLVGIAAVLVALVVVSKTVPRREAAAPAVTAEATREIPYAPFLGPVALGAAVTLSGDPGYQAELTAVRGSGAGTYTVHVRDLGTKPFDGALKSGVWLVSDAGTLTGPTTVTAGAGGDRTLIFAAPEQGSPAQLRITLHLGNYFPTAVWTVAAAS